MLWICRIRLVVSIFFSVVWKVVISLCGRFEMKFIVFDRIIWCLLGSIIWCMVGFSVVKS